MSVALKRTGRLAVVSFTSSRTFVLTATYCILYFWNFALRWEKLQFFLLTSFKRAFAYLENGVCKASERSRLTVRLVKRNGNLYLQHTVFQALLHKYKQRLTPLLFHMSMNPWVCVFACENIAHSDKGTISKVTIICHDIVFTELCIKLYSSKPLYNVQ